MTTRWKELCMDTTGEQLGRFWADVLQLDLAVAPGDPAGGDVVAPAADSDEDAEGKGIAMCRVPEEKTVKHRVHLDVYAASVDDVVRRGATVLREPTEQDSFTVLADPEGGEFCVFVREPDALPAYRLQKLIVDAADPERIARWWADVFGTTTDDRQRPGWWGLADVPGLPFETIVFAPVPEPKTVKNRIHWDVYGDEAALAAAGATLLRAPDDEVSWHVMADPQGNEFCVFTR